MRFAPRQGPKKYDQELMGGVRGLIVALKSVTLKSDLPI